MEVGQEGLHNSTVAWRWIVRVLLLAPLLLLLLTATVHFGDGLALESAFPVPVYTGMNVALPPASYAKAASALSRASARDGEAQIAYAEAEARAGGTRADVLRLLDRGLVLSPTSSRGWTLLAETLEPVDRKAAARALSLSFSLAPNDYWLLGRDLRAAGILWGELPDDTRNLAISSAGKLWTVVDLRVFIPAVVGTQFGPEIMTRAMRDQPDQIRAMNRWISARRLANEPAQISSPKDGTRRP